MSVSKEPAEVVNDVAEGKSTGDAVLDEKIERYLKLLEKRRDAINKFLQENYSDFNHSDYTPEEYVSHPINAYMLMKASRINIEHRACEVCELKLRSSV